jgi:hypothetical protein
VEREDTAVARQPIDKHLPAATDMHATIEEFWKHCLPCGPTRSYVARRGRIPPPEPCETQEATKREPSAWGYNRPTLFLGDINTGT